MGGWSFCLSSWLVLVISVVPDENILCRNVEVVCCPRPVCFWGVAYVLVVLYR